MSYARGGLTNSAFLPAVAHLGERRIPKSTCGPVNILNHSDSMFPFRLEL